VRFSGMWMLLGGLLTAPVVARAQDSTAARTAQPTQRPYFEFQVEEIARPVSGDRPVYPPVLRDAHVGGLVLVQFVVDAEGAPDMSTFKVLRTSHELFSEAVHEAVATMRFKPATIGGRAVRQVVQQPFNFAAP